MHSFPCVAQLVARLLWAAEASAAGGGYSEPEQGQRSKSKAFWAPQPGQTKQGKQIQKEQKTIKYKNPGVAQLVARLLWEQDAAGSNPVTRTT